MDQTHGAQRQEVNLVQVSLDNQTSDLPDQDPPYTLGMSCYGSETWGKWLPTKPCYTKSAAQEMRDKARSRL